MTNQKQSGSTSLPPLPPYIVLRSPSPQTPSPQTPSPQDPSSQTPSPQTPPKSSPLSLPLGLQIRNLDYPPLPIPMVPTNPSPPMSLDGLNTVPISPKSAANGFLSKLLMCKILNGFQGRSPRTYMGSTEVFPRLLPKSLYFNIDPLDTLGTVVDTFNRFGPEKRLDCLQITSY